MEYIKLVRKNNFYYLFVEDNKGITSIEYGLIAATIAIFVVSVLYGDNAFMDALKSKFELLSFTINNTLNSSE
ncbi:Flp family type IVb pilin [Bisgaard Taxon 46]